jgi:hypothetical protein
MVQPAPPYLVNLNLVRARVVLFGAGQERLGVAAQFEFESKTLKAVH